MKKMTFLFFLFVGFGLNSSFAGGYQVTLHGQKQTGMGLVGTSITFDAGCLFFNPGGLGFVKDKISVSAGVSFIKSMVKFQKQEPSVYEAETDNPMGTPFYFYAAGKINDKLSVGLAVNTPYGNSLKWGNDWAGKFLIEDIKLKAIFVQPTVSYKINNMLSFGAGLVYAFGDVNINKAIPVSGAGNTDGQVNISGKASSFGYNLGLLCKPTEKLQIGIDYRSKIDMNVKDGDVTMTVPSSLSTNFPATNSVDATLPLPANLDFGASYQLNDKVLVGFSVNYVLWSIYDSLIFDFKNNTSALTDSHNPREYKNTIIYRIGGQYEANEKFAFRAGAYYDPTPTNKDYFNPETPSLNNIGLTCGFSYKPVKKLSVDVSFLYVIGNEREAYYTPDNFGGKFKSRFYIPGFGLTYSL